MYNWTLCIKHINVTRYFKIFHHTFPLILRSTTQTPPAPGDVSGPGPGFCISELTPPLPSPPGPFTPVPPLGFSVVVVPSPPDTEPGSEDKQFELLRK